MKLKDLLEVIRESTRIKIVDENGVSLTAPLHKREITEEFNLCEVTNICSRYYGNGHTVRFYIQISIKNGT